jgi:hypothetical protein
MATDLNSIISKAISKAASKDLVEGVEGNIPDGTEFRGSYSIDVEFSGKIGNPRTSQKRSGAGAVNVIAALGFALTRLSDEDREAVAMLAMQMSDLKGKQRDAFVSAETSQDAAKVIDQLYPFVESVSAPSVSFNDDDIVCRVKDNGAAQEQEASA